MHDDTTAVNREIVALLEGVREGLSDEQRDDLSRALLLLESTAWNRGMDFGSSVMQRQLERHAELLLQVSASMRGKDRADGRITTDIYPDPAIYNWKGETE